MSFRRIYNLIRRIEEEMEEAREEIIRRMKEFEIRTGCISPLYNVSETTNEVIVSVDLPGSKKEDINVTVFEDRIIIKAKCFKSYRIAKLVSEKNEGEYLLELVLPSQVDPNNASAKYRNGVLEVRILKAGKGKTIKVE